MVDMSSDMKYFDFKIKICDRCRENKRARFYEWSSIITNSIIGVICYKCALLEAFGSNYRNSKKYKRFIKGENAEQK